MKRGIDFAHGMESGYGFQGMTTRAYKSICLFDPASQLSLIRTPLGPALAVRLREMSVL